MIDSAINSSEVAIKVLGDVFPQKTRKSKTPVLSLEGIKSKKQKKSI
ncbi:MAG: hypothetical protein ACI8RD_006617 [Bacillariaceae sp.]|jgi:hypothetical protein